MSKKHPNNLKPIIVSLSKRSDATEKTSSNLEFCGRSRIKFGIGIKHVPNETRPPIQPIPNSDFKEKK